MTGTVREVWICRLSQCTFCPDPMTNGSAWAERWRKNLLDSPCHPPLKVPFQMIPNNTTFSAILATHKHMSKTPQLLSVLVSELYLVRVWYLEISWKSVVKTWNQPYRCHVWCHFAWFFLLHHMEVFSNLWETFYILRSTFGHSFAKTYFYNFPTTPCNSRHFYRHNDILNTWIYPHVI